MVEREVGGSEEELGGGWGWGWDCLDLETVRGGSVVSCG